eukprot:TRINITY_DN11355_c0_g1_i1.p1 TRINITY_DN11355_c0_g1~~TRINITY_DN11355_c0_g1_i1.p1  ORF type:complete len:70 (-),score=7.06 TRINITY_DN11355_c0_g1_i1:308-517(-)
MAPHFWQICVMKYSAFFPHATSSAACPSEGAVLQMFHAFFVFFVFLVLLLFCGHQLILKIWLLAWIFQS